MASVSCPISIPSRMKAFASSIFPGQHFLYLLLLFHLPVASAELQKLLCIWSKDHTGQRKAQKDRLFSPTRQEFQGNPTIMLLKKIHWQITPAFRLTRSYLLIWLILSVTSTEIPGNLILTHGAKATCKRLTCLMFCNLVGWLFPYFLVTSPSNLRGRSGRDSQQSGNKLKPWDAKVLKALSSPRTGPKQSSACCSKPAVSLPA